MYITTRKELQNFRCMKISYNWLKTYLDIAIEPEKLAEILTNIGLEVGNIEIFESVKGGLEGLVIGKVETCEKHTNSDHLNKTTVNIGGTYCLPIVCGASNVAAGQKVVVATVGTTLYSGEESFVIKKSKIRGEVSEGMICAEDEIGLGNSHEGIMVLPDEVPAGTLAKDYFQIESDVVFEIDLTPNRIDAASHIGVARDIVAYLKQTQDIDYQLCNIEGYKKDNDDLVINITLENQEACLRYAGVTLTEVKVTESPKWLQNKLNAIGLKPINNVVDITNFVLHELGQPLHAFDAAKIKGNRVIVKTLASGTPFVTLDGEERKLDEKDLMICNAQEGMCIAGVFGGLASGVSESTTSIFLESACFNPVFVRKTARRHTLNTDASFRYERGTDPNIVIYALKRAALLIKELAGAKISADIIDIYPNLVKPFEVELNFLQVKRLIGAELSKQQIKNILQGLEIKIVKENEEALHLQVPPYRVDVNREADVIEEILRIYGYNNINVTEMVNSTLAYQSKPDKNKLQNSLAEQLIGQGFNEIMNNSLTQLNYGLLQDEFKVETAVKILNPLSNELNAMRQTLLFGMLETIIHNIHHKNGNLKLFEFGNCYFYNNELEAENPLKKYKQEEKLALAVSGNESSESWTKPTKEISFFYLKAQVENILERIGISLDKMQIEVSRNTIFSDVLNFYFNRKIVASLGTINQRLLQKFDIKQAVYFAELNWDNLQKIAAKSKVTFTELTKYPKVRRDLSLLIDDTIHFNKIREIAFETEKKLLKEVSLFDVYEGKKLGENKKSYAISFILQDNDKTLKDKQIDKIMTQIMERLKKELKVEIR